MTTYPTIVYRCPGPHFGSEGTTYSDAGVYDSAQLEQRLKEGYFQTMPEAVAAFKNPVVATEKEDNSPPTREELLHRAKELGLEVDLRWSEKTLLAKIEKQTAGG